jgi:hypothetical protein
MMHCGNLDGAIEDRGELIPSTLAEATLGLGS